MDVWISENDPFKQRLLAFVCAALGLVLLWGVRGFTLADSNALAGFGLGALLAVIGVGALVQAGRQRVRVDPTTRHIFIEDSGLFGKRRRVIAFGDIVNVGIGRIGKTSNFMVWYHLTLTLRSGEQYPLFAPGRCYAGCSERAVVAGWRDRLERYLAAPSEQRQQTS